MTTTYQVGRLVFDKLEDVPAEEPRVFRVQRGMRGVKHCELLTHGGHWRRVQPSMMLAGETVKKGG